MEHTRLDAIARAHDTLAPTYDATLARNPVASWMRERLWEHYARVIPPHARVLDFTAGTGADALFLAKRGAQVVALDVSPGMLEELNRRAQEARVPIETHVLAAEYLDRLDASDFDAAISSFAGLGTIENVPRLAHTLARLLEPRGRLIVHTLNSFCLWETSNQIAHLRAPHARSTHPQIGGEFIGTRFYKPRDLYRDAFASHFALRELYALSVIAAPTWVTRWKPIAPVIFRMDRALGRLFPAAGDFFVMGLEKRSA
ncbi:MAG: class I SAM-dependent methyltransferase [Chloroflexi bacterium]|nr:class I SAM-dependent methyltransferase [Chloroflexota bacterium]